MENLDWSNLSFNARHTKAVVKSVFRDGHWSAPEVSDDFNLHLDIFAGVFHYSNSCFEGLKAFRGADGKVRIFRPDENAKRMASSGAYLDMAYPSEEMFIDMCVTCVKENIDYLPPYGYGASLYIRPVLIGCNPQLGVQSSKEVIFIVMCSPVGLYSTSKGLTPTTAIISRNYDRAAPNGTGRFKLSANYATSLHPYNLAHRLGYGELLYLDSATKTKIDEFGSSNFMAIKGDRYVTPLSNSVLPSITNKSLQQIATDFGLTVEKRPIPVEELAQFDEVNACGTAVVITPIHTIEDRPGLESDVVKASYHFGSPDKCGPVSQKLYERIRGIQNGTEEDPYGWCLVL